MASYTVLATVTRLATVPVEFSSGLAYPAYPLGLAVWLWCISHTVSQGGDPCQAKATLKRGFLCSDLDARPAARDQAARIACT